MASATPTQREQAQARLSFAKVAASALQPPTAAQTTSAKPKPAVATPKILTQPHIARSVPVPAEAPHTPPGSNQAEGQNGTAGSSVDRTGQWTATAQESAAPSSDVKQDLPERPRSIAVVKMSAAEDSSTQLSSSDGSGKPPSIDGKSVASATTFALDEKESLRPDDSASLRAVEEEDITSPPDSVVNDSRHGSDHGAARAFRDQLHEIAVMNPQSQRGVPPGRFPNLPPGPHMLYDPTQALSGGRPLSQPAGTGMPTMAGVPSLPSAPDEKLIEALQSPRDRLFVVKIEQDFIDFIKDSRESEYSLPNCNTFYRMLAHRLADYYMLGHVVDSTMTGVKITRTPFCRIPPPLSQMVDVSKGADTPPVELPARKIMRREDASNAASNSQNPSKTTSEVDGSDGSNDGKDKAALTREEREARYREARQRIFGAEAEESAAAEASESPEDKDKSADKSADVSRSSSASGKKKSKKQRNYDDDDFQARSHFNVYYPQQFAAPGYPAENAVYYSGYSGATPHAQYVGSPSTAYSNPYPVMASPDAQSQYGWSGQQFQPQSGSAVYQSGSAVYQSGSAVYQSYAQMQPGCDLSADFQRGLSLQPPAMPTQLTPKMANTPMAPYQEPFQQTHHMSTTQGWPQMNQPHPYSVGQAPYSAPTSRPMSAPHPQPYAYGQFPPNPYNGQPNRNQHPVPGSWNRQQFNPQSQAFIPGGRNIPLHMHPNMGQGPPQMNGHSPFQMQGQPPMGSQLPRIGPSAGSTPSFGSPQSLHGNGAASMHRIASQTGEHNSSRIPPGEHNSIAKYGTPAHLPPKPPAPHPPPAPKFDLASLSASRANVPA
ncbi:uncharacterized protein M421DRAFT_68358 [Didymella exigua CBS 183.55]|uniref:SUZ domain-containing protein n=1 Tax=Didymella exigua CBS 183.55 TaxID=1150837 RepID=A0A6A5RKE2_9PLEO|nr:uncharacterized protein M421DRAFT_68358 [Didymella exigua CBS 183.55]KAF1926027.1 hypothetical protein M421DRAFT_68358 [Didymella exigua CBS 183.55]